MAKRGNGRNQRAERAFTVPHAKPIAPAPPKIGEPMAAEQAEPAAEVGTEVRPPTPKVVTITIELPTAPAREHAYVPSHVESRLNGDQGMALRRLFDGLDAAGCRLKNERRIGSMAEAARYVLERVHDALMSPPTE